MVNTLLWFFGRALASMVFVGFQRVHWGSEALHWVSEDHLG